MVFLRFGARLAIERGTSSSVAAKPVAAGGRPVRSRLGRQDVVMFTKETKSSSFSHRTSWTMLVSWQGRRRPRSSFR